MSDRSRVLIIYKSGVQLEVECDGFEVKNAWNNGRQPSQGQLSLKDPNPRPLLLGMDEIAAVWELEPKASNSEESLQHLMDGRWGWLLRAIQRAEGGHEPRPGRPQPTRQVV